MPDVIISGSEGRIEGRYSHSDKKNAPVALILHPHPLHGGSMNNKVVYNIYHSFVKHSFSTLRINFRGVGNSQGTFDNGIGELEDAATALDWLQMHNPGNTAVWIAGFSFGAWVAMQLLMRRPEIENFIVASPPVHKYDFSFLSPCPSPGLILQGNQDSIVPVEKVTDFANKLGKQKGAEVQYKIINKADHFFREKTDELSEYVSDYIDSQLERYKPIKVKIDRRRRQPKDK